jgi:hypothetical protein
VPNDNPYAPPQAPLETALPLDVEVPQRRPPVVALSVLLLTLVFVVLGLWRIVTLFQATTTGMASGVVFAVTAAFTVLRGWLIFEVWRGRNWARFILTATIVLGLLGEALRWYTIMQLPVWQSRTGSNWWLLSTLIQPTVTIVAAVMLFTSPATAWFRRTKPSS